MIWSHEPPTTPGWYWFQKYRNFPVEMKQLVLHGETVLMDGWSPKSHSLNTDKKCRWAGPVPLPIEDRDYHDGQEGVK